MSSRSRSSRVSPPVSPRQRARLLAVLSLLLALAIAAGVLWRASQSSAHSQTGGIAQRQVVVWLQLMDSCREAIGGGRFTATGGDLKHPLTAGPTRGIRPVTVGRGACPIQRGNCPRTHDVGCLSFTLDEPARGSYTYTLTETTVPRGYVECTGGSVCWAPETSTLRISSNGRVSASTRNILPDKRVVTYPDTGAPYSGAPSDPIVAHNSGYGSLPCLQGDGDADDHTTGSEGRSRSCDSDGDGA